MIRQVQILGGWAFLVMLLAVYLLTNATLADGVITGLDAKQATCGSKSGGGRRRPCISFERRVEYQSDGASRVMSDRWSEDIRGDTLPTAGQAVGDPVVVLHLPRWPGIVVERWNVGFAAFLFALSLFVAVSLALNPTRPDYSRRRPLSELYPESGQRD